MRDVFQFYSKSRPCRPGEGAGERRVTSTSYASLPRTFRQTLSNFALLPCEYLGKRYPSVEHAFHAAKILRYAPPETRDALADRFSYDAAQRRDPAYVGDAGAAVKRAGGKRGVFCMSAADIADWESAHVEVMDALLRSKFTLPLPANVLAQRTLLATQNAELWHFVRGKPSQRWFWLENLRDDLRRAECAPTEHAPAEHAPAERALAEHSPALRTLAPFTFVLT